MRNLIIKTSSLGDILHTLPALTDAAGVYPDIQFDWVVEEAFAEIPAWHPNVRKVIPIAWRRWRKKLLQIQTYREWQICYQQLRASHYDHVIDLQGLIKSAILTRCAQGLRCGLDYHSAWESLASLVYQHRYPVNPQQHAVDRMRQLMAAALGYPMPATPPDYGLIPPVIASAAKQSILVFLHSTTWPTKLWPESYWLTLAQLVTAAGYTVLLPWGNESERQRAERIAAVSSSAEVLPHMSLSEMAGVLTQAAAVVAVDTGLGHLAAALGVPTVSLYGPTNPALTGTIGANQYHLLPQFPCVPCLRPKCVYTGTIRGIFPACFSTVPPALVWELLEGKILIKP